MWNRPTVCAFFMSVINLARKLTPPRRNAPPEAAYVAPTPVLLMRTYWKYDASLRTLEAWEPDCWTQVTCPTPDDEEFLIEELHVPDYFLDDIRDKDERSRYEYDEGWSLIILRIPYIREVASRTPHTTHHHPTRHHPEQRGMHHGVQLRNEHDD